MARFPEAERRLLIKQICMHHPSACQSAAESVDILVL